MRLFKKIKNNLIIYYEKFYQPQKWYEIPAWKNIILSILIFDISLKYQTIFCLDIFTKTIELLKFWANITL